MVIEAKVKRSNSFGSLTLRPESEMEFRLMAKLRQALESIDWAECSQYGVELRYRRAGQGDSGFVSVLVTRCL